MTDPRRGIPEDEILDTPEDMERLAEIGDLIRAGHATIDSFDLGAGERAFVLGYVGERP